MKTFTNDDQLLLVTEVAIQHVNQKEILVQVNMEITRKEFYLIKAILKDQYPNSTHLFLTYQELEITPGDNPHARKHTEDPVK